MNTHKIIKINNKLIRFPPAIAQIIEHFTKLAKHTYTRLEAADVTSLLYSACNFGFVVAIVIVQMCLVFKTGLRRSQERSLDIDRALKGVALVQSSIKDCIANIEQFNRQCFAKSVKICDIEVKKPRICRRQIMRTNVQAEGPKD